MMRLAEALMAMDPQSIAPEYRQVMRDVMLVEYVAHLLGFGGMLMLILYQSKRS